MEESNNKSKYNISLLILQQISQMMSRANSYYRSGHIDSCFYEWKAIKFLMIGKLKPEERNKLKDKEKEIAPLLRSRSTWKQACTLVEDYITDMQDYIERTEIGLAEKANEKVFT